MGDFVSEKEALEVWPRAGRTIKAQREEIERLRAELADRDRYEESMYEELQGALDRGLGLEVAKINQHCQTVGWTPFDPKTQKVRDWPVSRYRVVPLDEPRLAEPEGQEPVMYVLEENGTIYPAESAETVEDVERLARARYCEGDTQKIVPLYTTPPPAPSVPDGFKLWRDENGDLRLDDLKRDLHIIVPSYYPQHGDLWLKVVGGLLDAMLTATPAPPRSESLVQAEALESFATWLMKQPGVAANQMSIYQWLCDEAARLRS